MSISMKRINEIINNKCEILFPCGKVQYEDKWTWAPELNEQYWEGFKRTHPRDYEREVNKIFDELHPY